jgi:hypothetical protein
LADREDFFAQDSSKETPPPRRTGLIVVYRWLGQPKRKRITQSLERVKGLTEFEIQTILPFCKSTVTLSGGIAGLEERKAIVNVLASVVIVK